MLDSIVYHCFLRNKIIKKNTLYNVNVYLPFKDKTIAFAAYHIL